MIDLINGSIKPDPKDPQLHARVRRESEVAAAKRDVVKAAKQWRASEQGFARIALRTAVDKLIEAEDAKC